MNSYEKYLKYKFKYLSLKKEMTGGAVAAAAAPAPSGIKVNPRAGFGSNDYVSGPVGLYLGNPLFKKSVLDPKSS